MNANLFSPDGRMYCKCGYNSFRVWKSTNGTLLIRCDCGESWKVTEWQ
jgi:hypothetical protein